MAWDGKELKDPLFLTSRHMEGHPTPDQVAQCPIQPDLEHLPRWGTHSFSVQSVPVPHHTHWNFFLKSNLNLLIQF